ncbi:MAG: hypothetical protein CM1200mP29_05240 [Verrucomicrobiota bacterium]|nr:MAG: hypothetical protein CM1200mP29_05240 [Verrucomicrobiota bacterium]
MAIAKSGRADRTTGTRAATRQRRAALQAARASEERAKRKPDAVKSARRLPEWWPEPNTSGSICPLATPLGEFLPPICEGRLPLISSDLSFIDLPRTGVKSRSSKRPRYLSASRPATGVGMAWPHYAVGGDARSVNRMVYVVAQVTDPLRLGQRHSLATAKRDIRSSQH